jgi:hypothetical protein
MAAVLIASVNAVVAPTVTKVSILPPATNIMLVALTNVVTKPSVGIRVVPLFVTGIEINFAIFFVLVLVFVIV